MNNTSVMKVADTQMYQYKPAHSQIIIQYLNATESDVWVSVLCRTDLN